MGCKARFCFKLRQKMRFNRNIMGCKERIVKQLFNDSGRFNRNIMGCKDIPLSYAIFYKIDLIGT